MKQDKLDAYGVVTDRIIALLEKGTVPWRKTWDGTFDSNGPVNAISHRPYHGINVMVLMAQAYTDRRWLTFKQAQSLGGTVRRGEKGTPVVFWKFLEKKEDGKDKPKVIPFLRYFTVFNVEQCDGLELKPLVTPDPKEFDPIASCESVMRDWKDAPLIALGGDVAAYVPQVDRIKMPRPEAFASAQSYYGTLFHESVHATGHESRVGRDGIMKFDRFGSEQYGREELVAEMGAAFLAAETGIVQTTIENTAAYCKNWIDAIKADKRAVVVAAGAAQKAVAWIRKVEDDEEEE